MIKGSLLSLAGRRPEIAERHVLWLSLKIERFFLDSAQGLEVRHIILNMVLGRLKPALDCLRVAK